MSDRSAQLIISNLTPEQAKTLASWFEGQGEQDCVVWFEARDIEAPMVDVHKKYKQLPNGGLEIFCK